MRRMMEDALRQKKEEQIKESAARKKAEEAAAMLPLLALMKLMQSDSDSGTKVTEKMTVTGQATFNCLKVLCNNFGLYNVVINTDREGICFVNNSLAPDGALALFGIFAGRISCNKRPSMRYLLLL